LQRSPYATAFVLWAYLPCALAFALFLTGATPVPRDMEPLRGTIQWKEGDIYLVKSSDGGQLRLKLATNSAIAKRVNTALWPIGDGSYLGIAAITQADGSLRAIEVGIFHETLRGAAEGHHRSGDLQVEATMYYGTAWQVARTADGDLAAVLYNLEGQKMIVIPSGTTVATYLSGNVSDLSPGDTIWVPAVARRQPDLLEAEYVMLERQATR